LVGEVWRVIGWGGKVHNVLRSNRRRKMRRRRRRSRRRRAQRKMMR
jgi:hypothetical protein